MGALSHHADLSRRSLSGLRAVLSRRTGPHAAADLKSPISTARTGKAAVRRSSPPIAAIIARNMLTVMSGRRASAARADCSRSVMAAISSALRGPILREIGNGAMTLHFAILSLMVSESRQGAKLSLVDMDGNFCHNGGRR